MGAVIVKIVEGGYINKEAVDNVIQYDMRLQNFNLMGGYGVFPITEESAILQFHKVKKAYGRKFTP